MIKQDSLDCSASFTRTFEKDSFLAIHCIIENHSFTTNVIIVIDTRDYSYKSFNDLKTPIGHYHTIIARSAISRIVHDVRDGIIELGLG